LNFKLGGGKHYHEYFVAKSNDEGEGQCPFLMPDGVFKRFVDERK
jgi:hypothetical protein